ncbi:MAG TPA: CocE/NonD family hydrolase C-terminal non-catalytic domain-containing protein, partial [Aeromicrobium sp.]|nr:CocE/NonD family hydrolase C-terminal non-catalytic domain-containing protein [Aeromicrobium sp.]
RYVQGVDNGVENEPAVQMYAADGSRRALLAGQYVRVEGDDWPLPNTTWESLYLTPDRSGGATSSNDGSLSLTKPAKVTKQHYLSLPSLVTQTDPDLTALLDGAAGQALQQIPGLTEMNLSNLVGLTYTTPPLKLDVLAVGPGTLEISLSSLAPATGIWAVISDVAPDGTANPMTTARLNTAFPHIVESKSLYRDGKLVQPYGDFSKTTLAALGRVRTYHVEMWPVANRFKAGHRIQVTLVGQSIQAPLGLPSLNSVVLGGAQASSLTFPVAPGSDLAAALD